MSIHIILGKPGSGKSMYGTYKLCEELVFGHRNVVTNLPIRPAELNAYIQTKFPDVNTNFVNRLRIMTDDEMSHFWKFRGPPILTTIENGIVTKEGNPNGNDHGKGVAYFLDEAHIAFNARDWASLGREAIHYMSQHRKLGDLVWPITQSCGNLDKQFRSVAEDYTVLRNEYTAKMGIFKGMGRFVRKSYYSEPSGKAEPFETATFHIDTKGIASCYDTAKGIGVHGSKADIGRRAKGIPIWMIFPAFIVLGSLCVFIPMMGGRMASSALTGGASKKIEAAKGVIASQPAPSYDGVTPTPPPRTPEKVPEKAYKKVKLEPDEPRATGYLVRNGMVAVVMDDGSVVTEEDGRISEIKRGRVKIDGIWHALKVPPREAGKFLQIIDTPLAQKNDENKARPEPEKVHSSGIQSYDGVTQPEPQKQNESHKAEDRSVEVATGQTASGFSLLPTLRSESVGKSRSGQTRAGTPPLASSVRKP